MGKYDESWKEAIETFFPQFLEFFFPQITAGIDLSKEIIFLDKELAQITKDGLGGRRVDKLAKVYRKDGEEQWLLAHVEVQGYAQKPLEFEERMYVYNYRIFDQYDRNVISLAVLTDDIRNFRPEAYRFEFGDFRLEMSFPVVKLLDYLDRWEKLERSKNPFSVVVMAHLQSQQTRGKTQERFRWKLRLTRMLYERGYSRAEVLGLYRFIDWVLTLPEELEERVHEEIIKQEEEKTMPYITSAERIGMKKGLEQGMLEAAREMVLEVLEERFGLVSPNLEKRIRGMEDRGTLRNLVRFAARVGSLEEFEPHAGL